MRFRLSLTKPPFSLTKNILLHRNFIFKNFIVKIPSFSSLIRINHKMPPIQIDHSHEGLSRLINQNDFVMFSKSKCPFCEKAKKLFEVKNITPMVVDLTLIDNGSDIQTTLFAITGQRTVPSIFAFGNHIGGYDDFMQLENEKKLDTVISIYKKRKELDQVDDSKFENDVIVIGGGSGGIACAKECADNGKRVVLFDYVVPSPMNTKWGLGGTCVNVGCIPKKLMHQAALHGVNIKDSNFYGFSIPEGELSHDWFKMCGFIHNHIRSLNFKYRTTLRNKNIKYINALAKISGQNEITYVDSSQNEVKLTSKYIVLATGERPQYPVMEGVEHCITSDDIFWLKYPPKKILIIGASYVALECAGALHGMGYDVTVMVRSIFLRGYDQEMAERIGKYMEKEGIKFIKQHIPVKVECLKQINYETKEPGVLKVYYKESEESQELKVEEFNTVLLAVGRVSCTKNIGLETIGIKCDSKYRVASVDDHEQTICPSVFAIGDILANRPQLTPVAIKAGVLLARRLCKLSYENCDYNIVPTTVFTPLEYGAIGYSEERAIEKFGEDDVDVYFNYCEPLEKTIVEGTDHDAFYAKIICRVSQKGKVIGLHILAPNAGEITQGYAVALRMGATITDFSATFGIHPTTSEVFTNMKVTKRSKKSVVAGGC